MNHVSKEPVSYARKTKGQCSLSLMQARLKIKAAFFPCTKNQESVQPVSHARKIMGLCSLSPMHAKKFVQTLVKMKSGMVVENALQGERKYLTQAIRTLDVAVHNAMPVQIIDCGERA